MGLAGQRLRAGVAGGDIRFATTGLHTIRVQVREDGFGIDQIVLSAAQLSLLGARIVEERRDDPAAHAVGGSDRAGLKTGPYGGR